MPVCYLEHTQEHFSVALPRFLQLFIFELFASKRQDPLPSLTTKPSCPTRAHHSRPEPSPAHPIHLPQITNHSQCSQRRFCRSQPNLLIDLAQQPSPNPRLHSTNLHHTLPSSATALAQQGEQKERSTPNCPKHTRPNLRIPFPKNLHSPTRGPNPQALDIDFPPRQKPQP